MNFKPILFSTEMVKAILSNRKTMTRREIKGLPDGAIKVWNDGGEWIVENEDGFCWDGKIKAKYSIGDVLWVREKFQTMVNCETGLFHSYDYYADMPDDFHKQFPHKFKPSIHMPKSACRLFLEVTNVRAERLQEISNQQAVMEGVSDEFDVSARVAFGRLWHSINGAESWKSNPFVWVITFKIVERPENFLQ